MIGMFLPCIFPEKKKVQKPTQTEPTQTEPTQADPKQAEQTKSTQTKSKEEYNAHTKEKYNNDRWYPTAKNIFHRGYEDDRFKCLTPLTFFYATPKVKLFTYAVRSKCYQDRFAQSLSTRFWIV